MDPTLGSYHRVLGSLVLGSLDLGSYHGVLGSLVLGSLVLWSLVLGILVLRAPRTKAPSHFPNPPHNPTIQAFGHEVAASPQTCSGQRRAAQGD